MYMRKLERLELDGLPGLYPGSVTRLSSLSEAPWEIDIPLHFATLLQLIRLKRKAAHEFITFFGRSASCRSAS